MPIVFMDNITRSIVRSRPGDIFVFGDNCLRKGFGGQAKEIRGEPNAVGVPTKILPSMEPAAFYSSSAEDYCAWIRHSRENFQILEEFLEGGGTVVWPLNDIGTGLAQLPSRAPNIWKHIQAWKEAHK